MTGVTTDRGQGAQCRTARMPGLTEVTTDTTDRHSFQTGPAFQKADNTPDTQLTEKDVCNNFDAVLQQFVIIIA